MHWSDGSSIPLNMKSGTFMVMVKNCHIPIGTHTPNLTVQRTDGNRITKRLWKPVG